MTTARTKRRIGMLLAGLGGAVVFAGSARADHRIGYCDTGVSITYSSYGDRYYSPYRASAWFGDAVHAGLVYDTGVTYVSYVPAYLPLTYGPTYVVYDPAPVRRQVVRPRHHHRPRYHVTRGYRSAAPRRHHAHRSHLRSGVRHSSVGRRGFGVHHRTRHGTRYRDHRHGGRRASVRLRR